jgi:hypothetical protein
MGADLRGFARRNVDATVQHPRSNPLSMIREHPLFIRAIRVQKSAKICPSSA